MVSIRYPGCYSLIFLSVNIKQISTFFWSTFYTVWIIGSNHMNLHHFVANCTPNIHITLGPFWGDCGWNVVIFGRDNYYIGNNFKITCFRMSCFFFVLIIIFNNTFRKINPSFYRSCPYSIPIKIGPFFPIFRFSIPYTC